MASMSQHALDSIDRFIAVGHEISRAPVLDRSPAAAYDLYEIAQKLLVANENMAKWLNRFLYFDFRDPAARTQFLDLVEDYRNTKSGVGFHDMKFSCGDVFFIYQRNIEGKLAEIFPGDEHACDEAKQAFQRLGDADGRMVGFIYDAVIGGIDDRVRDAEDRVDRSDLNAAEEKRLKFKVSSATLTARLERFGGELSDLVLKYARLAGRPVTLT